MQPTKTMPLTSRAFVVSISAREPLISLTTLERASTSCRSRAISRTNDSPTARSAPRSRQARLNKKIDEIISSYFLPVNKFLSPKLNQTGGS